MLLYNNTFLPVQDMKLAVTNRAFQYNDGFFETIMVVDGKLRFWLDHQARIREAALALQLDIPDYFWDGELEENLLQLAKQHKMVRFGRLKLKVWRSGDGLYTPQSNEIEWIATGEFFEPIPDTSIKVGICESVRTYKSPLSHFKGPHAPLYVLAGIEKRAKGFDDMLLLNAEGYVTELISSNIFWVKDDILYTPSLETGCVYGILRRNILRWTQQHGISAQETFAKPDELHQADVVFASNVTGIKGIARLAENSLQFEHQFLSRLKARLL